MSSTNTSMSETIPEHCPPRRGRLRRMGGFLFRTTRNLLAVAMLIEVLAVLVPVPEQIYRWLCVGTHSPAKADYIVCLGGGSGREARAAELWHRKLAPLVIVTNAPGAAEHMRSLVIRSGVPGDCVLVDNTSYTTGEHPAGVARVPGVDRQKSSFIILTDEVHTRRALACFVKAGYRNVCTFVEKHRRRDHTYFERCKWRVLIIPSLTYECLGLAEYWVLGRI